MFAQYEPEPPGACCILDGEAHLLESGKPREIVELADGKATLPGRLYDGAVVAYWEGNDRYYPTGVLVSVEQGSVLYPITANKDSGYYAIIDGDGGKTSSGGEYNAARCYITSFGELNMYYLDEIEPFSKEGHAAVGYRGDKTGTEYPLTAAARETMAAEADENNIARFTAQYVPVDGGYIQYIGNGAQTKDGIAYVIQDGLNFDGSDAAQYIENPFVAPSGKYFLGWWEKELIYDWYAQGKWHDPGEPIQLTGNALLYAQWGRNRVVYHYTGRWGDPAVENSINEDLIRSVSSYSEDSAVFEGWCTKADGTGEWYYPRDTVSDKIPDGTVLHLYERWLDLTQEGYYYILSGPKMRTQIIPMSSEKEQIILPETEYCGWIKDGTKYEIRFVGFLDQEPGIYPPGSVMTVTSGDHITVLDPATVVEFNENHPDYQEQRVCYEIMNPYYTSSADLRLYSADEVFSKLPQDADFTGWNTKPDGTGQNYRAGSLLWSGFYKLYAMWKDFTSGGDVPSGGHSSGSSSDDRITTTVTTNPDGSRTTTQTDKATGTVTQTTRYPDGSTVTTETKKDGTATKTAKTADGVTGTTAADSRGRITGMTVSVPASFTGGTVTAPIEAPAAKDSSNAPEIAVKVGSGDTARMDIPVSEFGPGTVAVVVNPDGSEEIVRDCVIGENGVVLNVEDGMALKIVDNSKTFADVQGVHWAEDAVTFAAARELFSGTGANQFSPDINMSRGMFAEVLYHLAYEPEAGGADFIDVSPGAYYADAVAWAEGAGMISGYGNNTFGPNDGVTREQMVTILYHYAQRRGLVPSEITGSLDSFTDAGDISGYAVEAMRWAVNAGLISGVDGERLAPKAGATRAQVATVLMLFCEKVIQG
ncbi:S-layer homology domain-containing protein [uncultured Mailhella sp.]|uniref:S-layer homology domain-containing protein n=1 Tax=uncultured Mailhella sp. TaxID=1981031 RepID=UPI00260300A9|nr:S-layer homology domain-containing protein [uncultured Mailhella sp.]